MWDSRNNINDTDNTRNLSFIIIIIIKGIYIAQVRKGHKCAIGGLYTEPHVPVDCWRSVNSQHMHSSAAVRSRTPRWVQLSLVR